MHKTLIKIFAVLIIPVFLFACKEEGAGGVSKEDLGRVLQLSLDTSKELDAMLLKAYGLAQLGNDMAASDPDGAMAKFEEAFQVARQANTPKYKNIYKELSAETADWPRADKDQVSAAINSIGLSSSRVWIARSIAEGMYAINPAKAVEVANWALNQTGGIPDEWYRDLDLRGISAFFADKDVASADNVAMRIGDLRLKSYAYRTISDAALAAGNRPLAFEALKRAAGIAETIPSMDAKVPAGMYAASAPESVKEQVQAHENAKLQAYAARLLASIAVDARGLNSAASREMLEKAVAMAEGIDEEFSSTRAYALSDIAAQYANVDTNAANALLGKLGSENANAKATGIIKVAKVKAGYNLAGIVSDITPLTNLAEEIEEMYERDMALCTIGSLVAPASPDKARELASEIESPSVKNALLVEVAKAWASENVDEAKLVIEDKPGAGEHHEGGDSYFQVLHYAPVSEVVAYNVYQKAVAYKAMGDELKETDPDAAMKLYSKAAGYAGEAGSAQMEWMVAAEMCKIDHTKFVGYAAKLTPADTKSQTMALMSIASDWSMNGDPYAGLVWDEAIKTAGLSMDNFEAGCLLGKIGAACSASFPDKSANAFAMSAERYGKIGME